MSDDYSNNNIIKTIQLIVVKNFKLLLVVFIAVFLFFILFQTYSYFNILNIEKNSINFFNSTELNEDALNDLEKLIENNNIFSTLSSLKIIQYNNEINNFEYSNKLYRNLVESNQLDNLYKSSIAAHATYTLINATYIENTTNYFEDIAFYISNISDELDEYHSIKKELNYLNQLIQIDINDLNYKNNSEVIDLYNEISESDLISSSVKERVKNIHEFQLYN